MRSDENKPKNCFFLIEGFYGIPYSQKSRLGMIEFLADLGNCNRYSYAPKADRLFREDWRTPLKPSQLNQLKEVAEVLPELWAGI